MMKVLLLSGGIDSAVLFYDLISQSEKFRCVWFDYGQKNAEKERQVAEKLCNDNFIPLKCIEIPEVFRGVQSTILKGVEGRHTVQSDELPNRNAVFIMIASAHCTEPSTILVGAHKTGAAYVDATPQFYSKMSRLVSWNSYGKIDVEAPYIKMTKVQILNRAWDLALTKEELFAGTVSCYEGSNCGICPACIVRRDAFARSKFGQ